jgi:PAS domain S-box-containing protein
MVSDDHPIALVVNDDADMLALTAAQVRNYGLPTVLTAPDGDAALEVIRAQRPDLVISDVSMPRVDGFQLCRILKSALFEDSDTIPVILTSATYRDVIAEQVARDVKAFAYLQQPHEASHLMRLMDLALKRAEPVSGEPHLLQHVGNAVVIDDDPDVTLVLEHLLTQAGWNVAAADNGAAARSLLANRGAQIIFLDYNMPDTTGVALLKWIKENIPEAVVIAITASTDQTVLINLVKGGVDDYIRKPFTPEQILTACRNALNKYNFRRVHAQFQEKMDNLRAVSEYLDTVISLSQEAIFSCDLEGRVKIWNRGAEKLYGYTTDEIIGQVVDDFVDPPDHQRKSPDMVRLLLQRGGFLTESEALRRRKSGEIFPVHATYSAISDAGGSCIGFSVIERDVTTTRALEEEKIRSARLRAITQTAVTANDQVNTPLGVILGYAQLLQRKLPNLSPEDAAVLDVIQQQVLKIKGIMNKLKQMSDPIVKNYSIEGVTMFDLAQSR